MYVHMALTPGKEDAEPIVLRVAMTVHEPGDLCMFIGSYSYPAYYPSGEHFPCFWLEDGLRREEYDEWVRTATVPVDYSPDRARLSSLIGSYQEDEERFLRDEGWDRYSAAVDGHRHLLEEVDASEQELRSAADELEELRSQLKTRVYGEGLPMPAYSEVTTNLEDYKGCLFLVSGRVTGVRDTSPLIKKTRDNPKGGDYDPIEVFVFWDGDERVGEVAHVEIRRAHYRTQVRERGRFTATCVLTGVDERGHPVLTCTSYSYKR